MPYKSERIKIEKTEYDARIKISTPMKVAIKAEQGILSQRATARKYNVSRRMVQFIWCPEKLEKAKELYKERRKDGRYYVKEKHTKEMKKTRRKKQRLYLSGIIKLI